MSNVAVIVLGVVMFGVIAWLIVLQLTKLDEQDIAATAMVTVSATVRLNPIVNVNQANGNDSSGNFETENAFATVEGALVFLEQQNQMVTWSGTATVQLVAGVYDVSSTVDWKVNLKGGAGNRINITTDTPTVSPVTAQVLTVTKKYTDVDLVQEIIFSTPDVPVGTVFFDFAGSRYVCERINSTTVEVPIVIDRLVPTSSVTLVQVGTTISVMNTGTSLNILVSNGIVNLENLHFLLDPAITGLSLKFIEGGINNSKITLTTCFVEGQNMFVNTRCDLFRCSTTDALIISAPSSLNECYLTGTVGCFAPTDLDGIRSPNLQGSNGAVITGDRLTLVPSQPNNTGISTGVGGAQIILGTEIQIVEMNTNVIAILAQMGNITIGKLIVESQVLLSSPGMFSLFTNSHVSIAQLDANGVTTGSVFCTVLDVSTLSVSRTTGGDKLQGTSQVGITMFMPDFNNDNVVQNSNNTLIINA